MFPRFTNHIVFVSRHNLAEYLAAVWAGATALRALVTPEAQSRSAALKAAWEKRGGLYDEIPLNGANKPDIVAALDKTLARCRGESAAINLTGGLKLMTIAAVDWARGRDVPAFYVDTQRDRVALLGEEWTEYETPDFLNAEEIMAVYGFSRPVADARALLAPSAAAFLAKMAALEQTRAAIEGLNRLATRAREGDFSAPYSTSDFALRAVLAACEKDGILRAQKGRAFFASPEAAHWAIGGWLEEYVFMVLRGMAAERLIRDPAGAFKVFSGRLSNEIDAAFTWRNRLFILECKSGKNSPDAGILYKAKTVHDQIGGVFSRMMICSVKPPDPGDAGRAERMSLTLVGGAGLKNLREEIIKWSR